MPLQIAQARLLILDPQTQNTALYWDGLPLEHVRAYMTLNKSPDRNRMFIRFTKPELVTPALTEEQIAAQYAIHATLVSAGIVVTYKD